MVKGFNHGKRGKPWYTTNSLKMLITSLSTAKWLLKEVGGKRVKRGKPLKTR